MRMFCWWLKPQFQPQLSYPHPPNTQPVTKTEKLEFLLGVLQIHRLQGYRYVCELNTGLAMGQPTLSVLGSRSPAQPQSYARVSLYLFRNQ